MTKSITVKDETAWAICSIYSGEKFWKRLNAVLEAIEHWNMNREINDRERSHIYMRVLSTDARSIDCLVSCLFCLQYFAVVDNRTDP